jgi:hypothetical protein
MKKAFTCWRWNTILVLVIKLTFIPYLPAQAANIPGTWLQFSILEIKCLDETSNEVPEWVGEDDMALGGTVASKFGVDKINYRNAGDYNDGTTRQFTDWVFAEIPFDPATDHARILLSLVERDPGGGKEEHLEKLVNNEFTLTKQQVITDFLTLLNEASGTSGRQQSDTAFFPGFEALLGLALETAVEVAVTHLLNHLWQILIASFDDDIFTAQAVDSPDFTDPAIVASSVITGQVRFDGYRGAYQVTYQWQLVTKTDAAQPVAAYQPYLSLADVIAELQKVYEAAIPRRTLFLPLVTNQ